MIPAKWTEGKSGGGGRQIYSGAAVANTAQRLRTIVRTDNPIMGASEGEILARICGEVFEGDLVTSAEREETWRGKGSGLHDPMET